MLVWGTGLSLYAMLGIVVTYLPRLEGREVVRTDDLNSYTMLLVVLAYLLESLQVHILGRFTVGVGEHALGACVSPYERLGVPLE